MATIDFKLNEGLQVSGMSVEHFAALAVLYRIPKASKAKLYESFRGGKALDNETALKLWKVWEQVEHLVERMRPIHVAFNDPEHTKLLLDLLAGCDVAVEIRPKGIEDQEALATTE